jgi:hypothetical protein
MSKYAEYDRRADEADKRINELAARVAAMESGKGGDNKDLLQKIKDLEAQVKKLENENSNLKKQLSSNKPKKEKKEKKEKQPQQQQPSKKDKKAAKKAADAAKKAEDDKKKEAKLLKASKKEGGKKGQDICGLNEMGGVLFFHITVDNAFGRWDLMELTMEGFNAKIDPEAEDRKGGAAGLGKALFSAGDEKLLVYINVPKAAAEAGATGKEWCESIMICLGPQAKIIEEKGDFLKVEAPKDENANLYPLKMRDAAIGLGFDFLRKRKLVIDADSDDDMDYGAMADEAGVSWGADDGDY